MHANTHSSRAEAGGLPQVRGQPELHSETLGGKREGREKRKIRKKSKIREKTVQPKRFPWNYCCFKTKVVYTLFNVLKNIDRPPSTEPIVHNV